jgi:hypothetical protein
MYIYTYTYTDTHTHIYEDSIMKPIKHCLKDGEVLPLF